ncbi:MAG: MFS transporter [Thaumarchaeota archaeon]|nr:MFS transporter [Nitrososphaerota archaeon]
MFESRRSLYSVASLVAARIIYAVNWVNLGPIYTLMEPDLHAGVGGLGVLTAAFFMGLGIFQVPGGVLAARWGPRRVVTLGIMMSSFAVLGTSASGFLLEAAVFRFVVGAGMAFVFAPAVVLVARFMSGRRSGMAAGLYNSAFDIGGILGTFAWIVVAGYEGWRPSLFLSGAIGIGTGALVLLTVPGDTPQGDGGVILPKLVGVLKEKRLILIGLGVLGTDIGMNLVAGFVVYYLVNSLGVQPAVAGLVGGMVFAVAIFSTLWGGRVYDRLPRPRLLMLLGNLGVVAALVVCSVPSILAALVCTVALGIAASISFTVAFAAARDINRAGPEYDSLAIAWVNCIGLFGSFWPPLVFAYLVGVSGYSYAWLGGALLALLFTVPLLALKEGVGD